MDDQYSLVSSNCLLSSHPSDSNNSSQTLENFVHRILELSVTDKEDQVLLLLGAAGSGKTCTFNRVRNLILTGSDKMKGIRDADAILNAFGHVYETEEHFDASKFGKYVEYQFDSDGTFLGYKVLDFFLQKHHIYAAQPFHIFNHLIAGATANEKEEWCLNDFHRYLGIKEKSSIQSGSHIIFGALRKQLKGIGCGSRMQQGLFQVLAAILHLGDINFEVTNIQETCKIKNQSKCSTAAKLLGCNEEELQNALITRSTLIGAEKCSVVLGTFEAAQQRNQLAALLYSLIFSWLVEQINKKYCVQDDIVSQFIGIFDFPGILANRKLGYGFEQLLVNYMSESLDCFAKYKICDKKWLLYDENDLGDYCASLKKIEDQSDIVDMLGNEQTGLILRFYSNKPTFKELNAISHKVAYLVPDRKRKLASNFSIRHFTGTVDYRISDLDTSTDSFVGADFVSLFGNAVNLNGGSNVTFIRQLFNKKLISLEYDPNSPRTVVKADASNFPKRTPSYSGQLTSNSGTPVSHLVASFKLLLDLSMEVPCHVIYHLTEKRDDEIRGIFGTFGLEILSHSLAGGFFTSIPHAEFLYRYLESNPRFGFSESSKEECQLACKELQWDEKSAIVGKFRVFLSYDAWKALSVKVMKQVDDCALSNTPTQELLKVSEDNDGDSELNNVDECYADDLIALGAIPDLELGRRGKNKIFDAIRPIQPSNWRYPIGMSRQRKLWVTCTWILTWFIPSGLMTFFKQKTNEVRMAFREKLSLCILILMACSLILFFIIGIGPLTCPNQNILSAGEVSAYSSMSNPLVIINGFYYHIPDILQTHVMGGSYAIAATTFQATVLGRDVSGMFYPTDNFAANCPGFERPSGWDNLASRDAPGSANNIWYAHLLRKEGQSDYLSQIVRMRKGFVARDKQYIASMLSADQMSNKIMTAWGRVYDVTSYYSQYNIQANSSGFMGPFVKQIFDTYAPFGKDATIGLNQLGGAAFGGMQFLAQVRFCLDAMFFVGVIDHRNDLKCQIGNYVLLASSILLFMVISIKFVASLQFESSKAPEEQDKFAIIQVPCYTEGYESLLKTFSSIAKLDYDSQRKILFVICDGMMIGHGNDRPTPRIVLDILGVDTYSDPEPVAYHALGEGTKQMNLAKVYSGLYKTEDRCIPYIVVIKVGKPSEHQRPGNRGKRDSQLILLNFLNRVHYKSEMSPLEVTIYDHMKNNIGIHPYLYEYIMMIDADTEVYPDSLKRLISSMVNDSRIMGICGETRMANEKSSWVTMIQVYEYFISHHMAKAFESLFGCVTCLPGCFSLYRIRNVQKNKPILICNDILRDYSINEVNTLHLKNLLELGEDRYLTTLLLKHFPLMKTSFNPDAVCLTMAPDRWAILLSQRRRWINSTVHNLFELLMIPQLCGFCCFSMRFIVLIDIFGTIMQPSALIYLGYIIYKAITDTRSAIPVISLVMIGCIYGFQLTIIFIKREFHYIGWMVLYLLAIPLSSFLIPLYSFWHFDDFSWGSTRKVFDNEMKAYIKETNEFDINCIPSIPYPDREKHPQQPLFDSKSLDEIDEPRTLNDAEKSLPTPHNLSGAYLSVTPSQAALPIHYMYQHMYPPITAIQAMHLPAEQPIVTNDLLIKELKRILNQSDLEKMTKKKVRNSLAQIFQVNLNDRKAFINMCIDKILQGEM